MNAAERVDVEELRRVAVDVAVSAADLVRRLRVQGVDVTGTKSSTVDVVTEIDHASEDLVREMLSAVRPDDAILGEEGGATEGTSGVTWVVDPVDGTVNLLYGIEEYAVSVAAVVDEETVAGAVVNVPHGTVYAAALGLGATRDGRPIRVRDTVPVPERLVLTGFGYQAQVREHQAACVARLLPRVRDIRRLGSCALDLCHVAEGVADGYVEEGPQPWDYAAGRLVVTEAGGRFALLSGHLGASEEGWPSRSVLAAAPAQGWDDFVGELRRAGFVHEATG